jgi:predicted transcriptional regulator
MAGGTDGDAILAYAVEIVSSYVANNQTPAAELPALLQSVHDAVKRLAAGEAAVDPALTSRAPAVSIRKSITPDYLICLEDGRRFKSLKRHLRTAYGMTPEDYRAKWGLGPDYPMVAPNYAKTRSTLAVQMGLGQKSAAAASRRSRR